MQTKQIHIFWAICACLLTACSSLDAGWRAQKSGDYEEARRHAAAALAKEPKNPEVYQLIATTAMSEGKYDMAVRSAEFASSLDGGTMRSQRLLRRAYTGKKAWGEVCETGLETTQSGRWEASDLAAFREAYQALGGKGEAYGCLVALRSVGEDPEQGEAVTASFVATSARKGKHREALAAAENSTDPDVCELAAARSLYALQNTDAAREKLRKYISDTSISQETREKRILSAADVASAARDGAMENEALQQSDRPENLVRKGIALRKVFELDASDRVFSEAFARADRSPERVIGEIGMLLDAHYGEAAYRAYETCEECVSRLDVALQAGDMFHRAGEGESVRRMMAERLENADGQEAATLFEWCRERGYTTLAMQAGETAQARGASEDGLTRGRLEVYAGARRRAAFDNLATEWIASHPSPAAEQRTTVARLQRKMLDNAGALETLRPIAQNLEDTDVDLYLSILGDLQKYEELDKALSQYRATIDPFERAAWFERSAVAEPWFRKSLAPVLNGDRAVEGHLVLANYLYQTNKEIVLGDEALARALELSQHDAGIYERIISFLIVNAQYEKAQMYAEAYRQQYTNEANAWKVSGDLELKYGEFEKATKYYNKYIELKNGDKAAVQYVCERIERHGGIPLAIEWLDDAVQHGVAPALEFLAELELRGFQSSRDAREQDRMKRDAIRDYTTLESRMDPVRAAYAFVKLNAYPEAVRNFERADREHAEPTYMTDYARALIRLGEKDDEIRRVVDRVEGERGTASMLDMLTHERALYLGQGILEKAFRQKETRDNAYSLLVGLAMSDNALSRVQQYAKEYEAMAPGDPEVRLRLARTAIQIRDWDEAVRHLTWLQALQPDARDTLHAEMTLARRATDHAPSQKLFATTLDAAEGIPHRLGWISEEFESIGDASRALYYAQKAWQASASHPENDRLRLIKLALMAGQIDREDMASHLQALRQTSLWNENKLIELAEVAQKSGYFEQAIAWMHEAASMAPNQTAIKRRQLEMALEYGSLGQIAQSLERAVDSPIAEVMEPLRQSGAYLDSFEAIELFAQNGQYEMAISSLLSVLPYYMEYRGLEATRFALENYVQYVPSYAARVADVLAQLNFSRNMPCEAFTYVRQSTSPDTWASFLTSCPEQIQAGIPALRDLRARMTQRQRVQFDETLASCLTTATENDQSILNALGIENTPYLRFTRALSKNDLPGALTALAQSPVLPSQHSRVISHLALADAPNEAADYAKAHLQEMSDSDRQISSAMAILMGRHDAVFYDAITSALPRTVPEGAPTWEHIAPVDTLTRWMRRATPAELETAIAVALRGAAQDASKKEAIFDAIRAEIGQRHSSVSLWKFLARHAIALEFHQDALDALDHIVRPDSDDIHLMRATALARLGRNDEAFQELELGARLTSNLQDYWERAFVAHQTSTPDLRHRIQASRLHLTPHHAQVLADSAVCALEAGDTELATQFAREAFASGQWSVTSKLTQAFQQYGHIDALPQEFTHGTSHHAYDIMAMQALQDKDPSMAVERFVQAAQRAPWPPKAFQHAIMLFIHRGALDRAEQLIARMDEAWPHASSPHAMRAILDLYQHKPQDAWNDYLVARKRTLQHHWTGTLIAHAILLNANDVAQNIINNELNSRIDDIHDILYAITEVFLDSNASHRLDPLDPQIAQTLMKSIESLLKCDLISFKEDTALLERLAILAKQTGDVACQNRLAILAL